MNNPEPKVPKSKVTKSKPMKRLGFMEGQFTVPDDFDTMCADEIEEMFYGPKEHR